MDVPEPTDVARRRWLGRLLEAATDSLLPEGPASPVADLRRRACLHEAACLRAYLAGEPLPGAGTSGAARLGP